MKDAQITIETADGAMPCYEALPEGEATGAIVVIQEAFGVTSHIEAITRRLADNGWHAIAPALFHRQGSPVLFYDDFAAVMPIMGQLTAEGLSMDLVAAFDHLEGTGIATGHIGIVGFCMGGSVSLYAATTRPIGAAVTFYGGGIAEGRFGLPPLAELAPHLKAPWLGHYGDLDKGIPTEEVEQLRRAAATATVPTEVVRYADADHGFNCNDRPAVFNPDAAAAAWAATVAFFERHLDAS